jgi:hypothetical protein
MLDEERSLLAGACACGNLRADARTRVIPILAHEAQPVRGCAKAGFQSLVSVPIRLQHRLLGEFDLFFRAPVTLSTEETELLDALASHLASALEGLRAEALEREAAVGEERALLARELHDSIAQSLAFMKIQVQLLRNAAQRGQPDKLNSILDELDAGVRESINDVRELLVHFRTRTNTENIEQACRRPCRSSNTRPACRPGWKYMAMDCRCRRTCRSRCCMSCRKPCPMRASTPVRPMWCWRCARASAGASPFTTTAPASTCIRFVVRRTWVSRS